LYLERIWSRIAFFLLVMPVYAFAANDVSDMVLVRGGCFEMGNTFGDGRPDELPIHRVCVDDFLLDMFEVTQEVYTDKMGRNPSVFRKCRNCPVENVSWYDASDYCKEMGKRLPTEAEWEFAARNRGNRYKYAGAGQNIEVYAWFNGNSGRKTHPFGLLRPNGLKLFDMTGNVSEWVADWYDGGYYNGRSPKNNPQGPSEGTLRVLRGGSWRDGPWDLRVTVRMSRTPHSKHGFIGIRCARNP
jgi:formylglycine-generating enzyme required for sulfatase activity